MQGNHLILIRREYGDTPQHFDFQPCIPDLAQLSENLHTGLLANRAIFDSSIKNMDWLINRPRFALTSSLVCDELVCVYQQYKTWLCCWAVNWFLTWFLISEYSFFHSWTSRSIFLPQKGLPFGFLLSLISNDSFCSCCASERASERADWGT